jgi:hypothetical protein
MLVHIDARHAHVLHPSEVRRHLLVASALRHLHLRPCLLSHLLILRLKLLATPATAMLYSKRKTMLAHCMLGLRRLMRAWRHRIGPAHHVVHPAPSPPPALQASAPPPADAMIQVSPPWTHVRMSATDDVRYRLTHWHTCCSPTPPSPPPPVAHHIAPVAMAQARQSVHHVQTTPPNEGRRRKGRCAHQTKQPLPCARPRPLWAREARELMPSFSRQAGGRTYGWPARGAAHLPKTRGSPLSAFFPSNAAATRSNSGAYDLQRAHLATVS